MHVTHPYNNAPLIISVCSSIVLPYCQCFLPHELKLKPEIHGTFSALLTCFDLTFIHVFGKILGSSFLEVLEALLIRQSDFFPISKGGIGFVFVKIIIPTTYSKS
jgi:hypothetical protein